jgi:DNA invertase Pin-like site-specific DNA recombinase
MEVSMIAAIYARKSTEQNGVADEAKSVTRQKEHAKAYAARKGWTVPEACIFEDDGISGAEFARRPGVQRLRAALTPRPAFQVLIVSEQSRLSRDTADTLQVLKELARAGVRVFGYQDDRAISLDTPAETLFTTVNAWKDSEARREASVRTYDALARKVRASHVAGGRVFGYRNVDVFNGADVHGRPVRSHVTREIHEAEAAVVRRIFELCAAGIGVKGTATMLTMPDRYHRGRSKPAVTAGRPQRCGRCSIGSCIAESWSGIERRSGTCSGRSSHTPGIGPNGCAWPRHTCGLCLRPHGRPRTPGWRRPGASTSRAHKGTSGADRRVARHPSTS